MPASSPYGLFWVFAPQNPFETDQARSRERDVPMLLALVFLPRAPPPALSVLGVGFNPALAVPLSVRLCRRRHPVAAGRR